MIKETESLGIQVTKKYITLLVLSDEYREHMRHELSPHPVIYHH